MAGRDDDGGAGPLAGRPERTGATDAASRGDTAADDGVSKILGHRLSRMRASEQELRERIQQLEDELGARTRRVHQLIGQRDQLATLLQGRDAEIQRLNRELGARSVGTAGRSPAEQRPAPWLGLLDAGRGWLGRLGPDRAGSRAAPSPAAAPVALAAPAEEPPAMPSLVPWGRQQPPRPVLATALFGLSAAAIGDLLDIIERQARQRQMVPLLLTDDDDFRVFRGRRLVVEFVPSRTVLEQHGMDRHFEMYLQRRLALIRRKWRPERIVAFGPRAAEVVRLWQASPFEDEPLPVPADAAAPSAAEGGEAAAR